MVHYFWAFYAARHSRWRSWVLPRFFLSFFVSYCRSSLNGIQPKQPHVRKWARFENACPKFGASPPLKIGGRKTTLFRRLRNFAANLTAYVFGTKHDIENQASALETTRVLYIASKCHELWYRNGLVDRSFYPPSVKFCILLHRQASHTEVSNLNSTKQRKSISLTICPRKLG